MLMICFCLCDVDTLMMTPKWVERWNALVKDEHGLVFLSLGLWTGGKLLLLLVTIWPDWQAGRSWLLHPSMAKLQHTNIYPCSSYIKKKKQSKTAHIRLATVVLYCGDKPKHIWSTSRENFITVSEVASLPWTRCVILVCLWRLHDNFCRYPLICKPIISIKLWHHLLCW